MSFLTTGAPIITVSGACTVALIQQWGMTRREKAERERKLLSAKATLPLTLSNVQQNIVKALKSIRSFHGGDVSTLSPDLGKIELGGKEEMLNLRDCIAYIDSNDTMVELMYFLMSQIQVTQSRLDAILNSSSEWKVRKPAEYDQMLFDLIFLKELLDRYYIYGRRKSELVDITVTREEMQQAALAEGCSGVGDLDALISRRSYADKTPETRPFFRNHT